MFIDFTPRLYQETMFATASKANTLIVLPTGLGKTNVFLMIAAHRLTQFPKSKILLLGPTRPLIDQYRSVFERHFDIDSKKLATLTGQVPPDKRVQLWEAASVIFSTPQGLENDILSKRISLKEVSLLGFDEAHRAVGDYSYVFISKQYITHASYPRIAGMTASPGNDVQTINDVCANLHIERIEIRTEDDPDVKPYVQQVDVEWLKITLPESFARARQFIQLIITKRTTDLKSLLPAGTRISDRLSRKDLLSLQMSVQGHLSSGVRDFSLMRAMSVLAEIMKTQHALELLESQGIESLDKYFTKLEHQAQSTKVKAVRNLVAEANFRSARYLIREMVEKGIEHPKMDVVEKQIAKILSEKKDAKIILFTQYRETGTIIQSRLKKAGISCEVFVGQAKKAESGMSQKEQKKKLDAFRGGEFNILISTSIGEEGLDVPSVDLVLFYEPVPSAIRAIQRRGRTGRQDRGHVIVLIAAGTRDEAYRWSAHHKEKLMVQTLKSLRHASPVKQSQRVVGDFDASLSKLRILIDYREKGSGVVKALLESGIDIEMRQLSVGDYHCSNRVIVELKSVEDFVDSIIDGRLLLQVKDLSSSVDRPLVLIVGESDLFTVRRMHANAIHGMLAAISVGYGIPIIRVRTNKEAAEFLITVAKREQEGDSGGFSKHSAKRILSVKEQQEYVVSSLPGVGATLAKPLLREFRTVKDVINASEERLKEVKLIGEKKAKDIRSLLDSKYVD